MWQDSEILESGKNLESENWKLRLLGYDVVFEKETLSPFSVDKEPPIVVSVYFTFSPLNCCNLPWPLPGSCY